MNVRTTKRMIFSIILIPVIILIMVFGCANVRCSQSNTYLLYKIGDNSTTQLIPREEIDLYVNDSYEWSIEPTVLMYTADGRTSWIQESEIEVYSRVGWSMLPPITIYSRFEDRVVLQEEVDDYFATGIWFRTREEARPITVTMDAFTKTNIPPEHLEKILSKGLSGYGQAFYNMEQNYGINSIFAISVAEIESGHGTSSAFRYKNNAFGLGPGMAFSSVESCINYFGGLMNKSMYYGKPIDRIGVVYCDSHWAPMVKSLMRDNYSGLGY